MQDAEVDLMEWHGNSVKCQHVQVGSSPYTFCGTEGVSIRLGSTLLYLPDMCLWRDDLELINTPFYHFKIALTSSMILIFFIGDAGDVAATSPTEFHSWFRLPLWKNLDNRDYGSDRLWQCAPETGISKNVQPVARP